MGGGQKQTIDCWTVRILWLLQARHCQSSLNPNVREFVRDTDKHGLVNAIEKVIVDLGILCHTTQQFINQLTGTKTHSVAADFMRLKTNKIKFKKRLSYWKTSENNTLYL